MLERLTSNDFAPLTGETFTLTAPDGERLELVLVEVDEHGTAHAEAVRAPFSVHWKGPGHRLLPQATYPLEHKTLGRLELFIVPIGREGDGFRYEAVFS